MGFGDRMLLIAAAFLALSAYIDSREAHRHAHEIGCHIGADDLCSYHKDTTNDH